mgnify:CR=1 FL=1
MGVPALSHLCDRGARGTKSERGGGARVNGVVRMWRKWSGRPCGDARALGDRPGMRAAPRGEGAGFLCEAWQEVCRGWCASGRVLRVWRKWCGRSMPHARAVCVRWACARRTWRTGDGNAPASLAIAGCLVQGFERWGARVFVFFAVGRLRRQNAVVGGVGVKA